MTAGGAVSPENRSNEGLCDACEANMEAPMCNDCYTRLGPVMAANAARDAALDSLAAVERERDEFRERFGNQMIAGAELIAERDAALARIAAVEAQRDALAVTIANEAQTLRAYHVGPLAAGNPVDAAHLADHLDAQLDAALAASPTPTGPEPATCEHESHAYIGEQRVGSFKELDGNRWAPCSATPTGPESCDHGLVRCAVCGTDSPATPEPTEETP